MARTPKDSQEKAREANEPAPVQKFDRLPLNRPSAGPLFDQSRELYVPTLEELARRRK